MIRVIGLFACNPVENDVPARETLPTLLIKIHFGKLFNNKKQILPTLTFKELHNY